MGAILRRIFDPDVLDNGLVRSLTINDTFWDYLIESPERLRSPALARMDKLVVVLQKSNKFKRFSEGVGDELWSSEVKMDFKILEEEAKDLELPKVVAVRRTYPIHWEGWDLDRSADS